MTTNWNNIVRRIACQTAARSTYVSQRRHSMFRPTHMPPALRNHSTAFLFDKTYLDPHYRRLETILFDSCFRHWSTTEGVLNRITLPSYDRSPTVHATLIKSHLQDDRSTSTSHSRSPTVHATLIKSHLQDDRSTFKPSHSRSTQASPQQEHLSQAVCRPTCHRRLDTRWPRSEGGVVYIWPTTHLTSLLTTGALSSIRAAGAHSSLLAAGASPPCGCRLPVTGAAHRLAEIRGWWFTFDNAATHLSDFIFSVPTSTGSSTSSSFHMKSPRGCVDTIISTFMILTIIRLFG